MKKKRQKRQHCWCCGELIAQQGVHYCPGCGTYNEIEYYEEIDVEDVPASTSEKTVSYILCGTKQKPSKRLGEGW